ncbi:MAG: acyl-CoA dehydrogenase family protein [Proteobacteria bacterium]|nr:acyl-CoA dehydrogenase family protein [Pseudomonadota bacterium]
MLALHNPARRTRRRQLEASRLLLMNAAYLKETHQPFMKQAAMAKLYATEAAKKWNRDNHTRG